MLEDEHTTIDDAQDLIYDAFAAETSEERIALAKEALSISQDCADAYVIFAEESESAEEALEYYRQGVAAGERALGPEYFEEDVGDFWEMIRTRPYMRARLGLAQSLWETGQREEAVEHYWEMLRLNPDDHQAIRESLMPWLIALDRDEDAERLFKQYEDSAMASWAYARALLDFRKSGNSPAADRSLSEAFVANFFVPHFLLHPEKMPIDLPEYVGSGDANEAIAYVFENREAWKSTLGALEWLATSAEAASRGPV